MAARLVFHVKFTKEGLFSFKKKQRKDCFILQVSQDIKRLDLVSLTAPHTALHFMPTD